MKVLIKFLQRYTLLGLLIVFTILFVYFRFYNYLHLPILRSYQAYALSLAQTHYVQAVLIYITIFIVLIACAIPCATVLSLIGGFLFGGIALLYADVAITVGGLILFFAVRFAFGKHLAIRKGWIKQMEKGFRKNAFYYLLTLRLVPIFPCWISNISAGALNVPVTTFLLATIICITPCTYVYVMAGRSLDKLLDQRNIMHSLLTPSILLPLLGLIILSLLPIIYKLVKRPTKD